MLISYNWLGEYFPELPEKFPPHKLAEELTLLGLEVTEVRPVNFHITGLKVGEVVKKWKHPNADRLNLTKIRYLNDGKEVIDQVVCGADNIAAGQKIILATVGTKLAPGFVIKKAKIRGEESCGMVCSREELGKEEKSEGIWVLPDETSLNDSPKNILGDPDFLLNFDITSNRWDSMSTFGIIREVSVLLGSSFTHKNKGSFATWEPKMEIADFPQLSSRVKVIIENPHDCYRYQGLDIKDIKVADSPNWLAERLFLHGLRPIENIVDVTNLILKEYGQPIHAFDADKIGKKITIRLAKKGENLTLLDGKKIKLTEEDLVIVDENRPIALAGVMGGLETGVTSSTKNVFLETAVFNPKRIRNTMTRNQLSTDAGRYFQHQVDPVFSQEVIRIAGSAIAYLGQGKISSQVIDIFPEPEKFTSKEIILTLDLLNKTLGFSFPIKKIDDIFHRLNFKFSSWQDGKIKVIVPSYRSDLNWEWDLIEEIARVYGYNKIPITHPRITNGMGALMMSLERKLDDLREKLRYHCLAMGFHEVLTYPLIENNFATKLRIDEANYLSPTNPVWSDISLFRNNLLFGFLKTIQGNTEKKVSGFNRIFEVAKVFSPLSSNTSNPKKVSDDNNKGNKKAEKINPALYEHSHLGLAIWDGEPLPYWKYDGSSSSISVKTNYTKVSGAVESIFQQLFKSVEELYFYLETGNTRLSKGLKNAFIPGTQVKVVFRNEEIGIIGEITDSIKNYFGLESSLVKKRIFYAELDLGTFLKPISDPVFKSFSQYPSIRRDLALVMSSEGAEQSIQNILKELPSHSSLLTQVNVTDIYQGENIPENKKSVVFNLEFTASDKTLKREEADKEVTRLVKILEKKYTFTLR